MQYTSTVAQGYSNLFAKMRINPGHEKTIASIVSKIASAKPRYQSVEKLTGVPWAWIAIVHNLEGNCDFSTYLGNGEPLSRKTTLVPRGRGPFRSWEEGAIDALTYEGLNKIKDWNLSRWLYQFEAWNGFGYVKYNINSPYLWSYSSLYQKGKYTSDGVFDSNAVSFQCGAAVILKALICQGYITFKENKMDDLGTITTIAKVATPQLASVFDGPASSIIVKMLADELKVDATPAALSQAAASQSATNIIAALSKVQDVINAAAQVTQNNAPAKANDASPALSSGSVLVDVNATTANNIVSAILFIVFSYFIKDAAIAHNASDIAFSVLTFAGGVLAQWFNRSTLVASNKATINKLAN